MKQQLKKTVLLSLISSIVIAFSASAFETQYTTNCELLAPEQADLNKPKRTVQWTSDSTNKVLSTIQTAINKNQYDEAIQRLSEQLEFNLSDADRATIQHNLAVLYAQKKQWSKAVEAETAAINSTYLQEQQELQARQNLAIFYNATENLAKTLEALKSYFEHAYAVKPEMYLLLGSVYAQMNKFQESICPTYIAISHQPQSNESWYSILLAAHYELKDLEGATVIAREMLERFPNNADNWSQLSTLLLHQEQDLEALMLMELAYLRGFLAKESDFKNLSSLYSLNNIPYKAAQVLEKAIEEGKVAASETSWRQVAQAWTLARELDKAVHAYGEGAKFVNDGTFLAAQGELYVEMEKWQDAANTFSKAIEKGGLNDVGRFYLNFGIAQFYLGDYSNALVSLEKSSTYDKSAKDALSWMSYVTERMKVKG